MAFPDESRVWIYQADRPFEEDDIQKINDEIDRFCEQWTSHNRDLRALGGVMHDQFIVLVVDETQASTSGCSIDKSVAFVKSLEWDLRNCCRMNLRRSPISKFSSSG